MNAVRNRDATGHLVRFLSINPKDTDCYELLFVRKARNCISVQSAQTYNPLLLIIVEYKRIESLSAIML